MLPFTTELITSSDLIILKVGSYLVGPDCSVRKRDREVIFAWVDAPELYVVHASPLSVPKARSRVLNDKKTGIVNLRMENYKKAEDNFMLSGSELGPTTMLKAKKPHTCNLFGHRINENKYLPWMVQGSSSGRAWPRARTVARTRKVLIVSTVQL